MANCGKFWERTEIGLSLRFLGRRGRGAQKIRTNPNWLRRAGSLATPNMG